MLSYSSTLHVLASNPCLVKAHRFQEGSKPYYQGSALLKIEDGLSDLELR